MGLGRSADSSENVLIERCAISCGDDHIAIKSGLDSFGLAVAKPSRNITVRGNTRVISDCHFRKTATEYDRKHGIKWLGCTEK